MENLAQENPEVAEATGGNIEALYNALKQEKLVNVDIATFKQDLKAKEGNIRWLHDHFATDKAFSGMPNYADFKDDIYSELGVTPKKKASSQDVVGAGPEPSSMVAPTGAVNERNFSDPLTGITKEEQSLQLMQKYPAPAPKETVESTGGVMPTMEGLGSAIDPSVLNAKAAVPNEQDMEIGMKQARDILSSKYQPDVSAIEIEKEAKIIALDIAEKQAYKRQKAETLGANLVNVPFKDGLGMVETNVMAENPERTQYEIEKGAYGNARQREKVKYDRAVKSIGLYQQGVASVVEGIKKQYPQVDAEAETYINQFASRDKTMRQSMANVIAQPDNVVPAHVKAYVKGMVNLVESQEYARNKILNSPFAVEAAQKAAVDFVNLKRDKSTYGSTIIARAIPKMLVNLAKGVATLPRTITANNSYGATDQLAENITEFADDVTRNVLGSSSLYDQEEVFGESVNVGKPLLVLNRVADMAAIMGSFMATGGLAAGAGASAAGVSAATMATSFISTHNDYYTEAAKSGLTPAQASGFAMGAAALTSALELIAPDARFFKPLVRGVGNKVPQPLAKAMVQEYARTLTSTGSKKAAMASGAKLLIKEIGQENLQEGSQLLGDKLAATIANYNIGEDKLENEISFNEVAETALLTTITTGLVAGIGARSRVANQLTVDALSNLVKGDYTLNLKNLQDEMVKQGIPEQDQNKVFGRLNAVKAELDKLSVVEADDDDKVVSAIHAADAAYLKSQLPNVPEAAKPQTQKAAEEHLAAAEAALNGYGSNKQAQDEANAVETPIVTTPVVNAAEFGDLQDVEYEEDRKVYTATTPQNTGTIYLSGDPTGRDEKVGKTNIKNADGTLTPARYALVPIGQAQPSHLSTQGFADNPNYPRTADGKNMNARGYQDASSQKKVTDIADDLVPEEILSNAPNAETGMPILDANMNVVGGNGRTMALQLLDAKDASPERQQKMQDYKDAMLTTAQSLGFSEEILNELGQDNAPNMMLVRVVATPNYTWGRKESDAMNRGSIQSRTSAEIADGITEGLKTNTQTSLDLLKTLEDAPDSKAAITANGSKMINLLVDAGLLSNIERNAYANEKGILPEGRTLLENILLAQVLEADDVKELYDNMNEENGRRAAILNALPQIVKSKNLGKGWNLLPALKETMAFWRAKQDEYSAVTQTDFTKPSPSALSGLLGLVLKTGSAQARTALQAYVEAGIDANASGGLVGMESINPSVKLASLLQQYFENKKGEAGKTAMDLINGVLSGSISSTVAAPTPKVTAPATPKQKPAPQSQASTPKPAAKAAANDKQIDPKDVRFVAPISDPNSEAIFGKPTDKTQSTNANTIGVETDNGKQKDIVRFAPMVGGEVRLFDIVQNIGDRLKAFVKSTGNQSDLRFYITKYGTAKRNPDGSYTVIEPAEIVFNANGDGSFQPDMRVQPEAQSTPTQATATPKPTSPQQKPQAPTTPTQQQQQPKPTVETEAKVEPAKAAPVAGEIERKNVKFGDFKDGLLRPFDTFANELLSFFGVDTDNGRALNQARFAPMLGGIATAKDIADNIDNVSDAVSYTGDPADGGFYITHYGKAKIKSNGSYEVIRKAEIVFEKGADGSYRPDLRGTGVKKAAVNTESKAITDLRKDVQAKYDAMSVAAGKLDAAQNFNAKPANERNLSGRENYTVAELKALQKTANDTEAAYDKAVDKLNKALGTPKVTAKDAQTLPVTPPEQAAAETEPTATPKKRGRPAKAKVEAEVQNNAIVTAIEDELNTGVFDQVPPVNEPIEVEQEDVPIEVILDEVPQDEPNSGSEKGENPFDGNYPLYKSLDEWIAIMKSLEGVKHFAMEIEFDNNEEPSIILFIVKSNNIITVYAHASYDYVDLFKNAVVLHFKSLGVYDYLADYYAKTETISDDGKIPKWFSLPNVKIETTEGEIVSGRKFNMMFQFETTPTASLGALAYGMTLTTDTYFTDKENEVDVRIDSLKSFTPKVPDTTPKTNLIDLTAVEQQSKDNPRKPVDTEKQSQQANAREAKNVQNQENNTRRSSPSTTIGKNVAGLIGQLSKAFPNISVVTDPLAVATMKAQLQTPSNAFVNNGVVYIDVDNVSDADVVEEFAHLWIDIMKYENPTLYNRLLELAKNSSYMDIVNSQDIYKNLSEYDKSIEAAAKAIAAEGVLFANRPTWLRLMSDFWNALKAAMSKYGIKHPTQQYNFGKVKMADLAKLAVVDMFRAANGDLYYQNFNWLKNLIIKGEYWTPVAGLNSYGMAEIMAGGNISAAEKKVGAQSALAAPLATDNRKRVLYKFLQTFFRPRQEVLGKQVGNIDLKRTAKGRQLERAMIEVFDKTTKAVTAETNMRLAEAKANGLTTTRTEIFNQVSLELHNSLTGLSNSNYLSAEAISWAKESRLLVDQLSRQMQQYLIDTKQVINKNKDVMDFLTRQFAQRELQNSEENRIKELTEERLDKLSAIVNDQKALDKMYETMLNNTKRSARIAKRLATVLLEGATARIKLRGVMGFEDLYTIQLAKEATRYEKLLNMIPGSGGITADEQYRKELNEARKEYREAKEVYEAELANLKTRAQNPTLAEEMLQQDIANTQAKIEGLLATMSDVVTKKKVSNLIHQDAANMLSANNLRSLVVTAHAASFKPSATIGEYDVTLIMGDGKEVSLGSLDEDTIRKLQGLGPNAWQYMNNSGGTGLYNIARPDLMMGNLMYERINQSIGTYLNRSYNKHDRTKDWQKMVRKSIGDANWDASVAYIRERMNKALPNRITYNPTTNSYAIINSAGVAAQIRNIDEFIQLLNKKSGLSTGDILGVENFRKNGSRDYRFTYDGQVLLQVNGPDLGLTFVAQSSQVEDAISDIISQDTNTGVADNSQFAEGIFKGRKDIPEAIRVLMGEQKDINISLPRTVEHLLNSMMRIEMEQALFAIPGLVSEVPTPVHTETARFYSPLVTNGDIAYNDEKTGFRREYYVTPEVASLMFDVLEYGQANVLIKLMAKLSGVVKQNMTVLSASSNARNFASSIIMSDLIGGRIGYTKNGGLANAAKIMEYQVKDLQGAENLTRGISAIQQAIQFFGSKFSKMDDAETLALLQELEDNGVLTGSLSLNTIKDLQDIVGADKSAITKGFKKYLNAAQRTYSAGDDFNKARTYLWERNRLMKIKDELGLTDAEVKAEAARITRATIPTYDDAPRIFRWISRFPLLGSFVMYQAEVYRTTWNIMQLGAAEIQEGTKKNIPALRNQGIKRLSSVAVFGLGMQSASLYVLAQAIQMALGDDDIEILAEDDVARVRLLLPEYMKNNTLIVYRVKSTGQIKYFDMSYVLPLSPIYNVVNAFNGKEGGFASGLVALIGPFVGQDIALHHGLNMLNNQDDFGRPIYQDQTQAFGWTGSETAMAIDQSIMRGFKLGQYAMLQVGPRLGKELYTIGQGVTGQLQPNGEEISAMTATQTALTGFKSSQFKPELQIKKLSSVSMDKYTSAKKILTNAIRDKNKSVAQLETDRAVAEANATIHFNKLVEYARLSASFGIDNAQLYGVMINGTFNNSGIFSEANIPASLRRQIFDAANGYNPNHIVTFSEDTEAAYQKAIQDIQERQ